MDIHKNHQKTALIPRDQYSQKTTGYSVRARNILYVYLPRAPESRSTTQTRNSIPIQKAQARKKNRHSATNRTPADR